MSDDNIVFGTSDYIPMGFVGVNETEVSSTEVYLLVFNDYDDCKIIGVYKKIEQAQETIEKVELLPWKKWKGEPTEDLYKVFSINGHFCFMHKSPVYPFDGSFNTYGSFNIQTYTIGNESGVPVPEEF